MSIPTFRVNDVPQDAYLLDVREDDEWQAGHIEGATHIPMSGLMGRVDEVPKDREVVVLCKVGGRSAQVTAFLRQRGWDNVTNLDGGVVAWVEAGRPLVTDTGAEATVL
ncbi:MAG TPA: rhodanese-like domain-containing protein [Frankiaceae bacterium]|nr:rhodanese-like domain-containing protein [Frankiaceae bacterium]